MNVRVGKEYGMGMCKWLCIHVCMSGQNEKRELENIYRKAAKNKWERSKTDEIGQSRRTKNIPFYEKSKGRQKKNYVSKEEEGETKRM